MPETGLRILYITANVLGDAGANAAEIFPRLSRQHPGVIQTIVADYYKNKSFIQNKQDAEFLKLKRRRFSWLQTIISAIRIARKSRDEKIDVMHVFYRQRSAGIIILLRLALMVFRAKSRILLDHRSVNLARGQRGLTKKLVNLLIQPFVHHLAGNPWAVETNHWFIFRPKHLIDLGYDQLPPCSPAQSQTPEARRIWFIGSLKPRNRKSDFLIRIFEALQNMPISDPPLEVHIAGPARKSQADALNKIPSVTFYGRLPRDELYELLASKPGIGIAFMNKEFHSYAPSLKFVEYAIMRFQILASNTLGLRTQAQRMHLQNVQFVEEDVEAWARQLHTAAQDLNTPAPIWEDAEKWSYENIFNNQVIQVYETIAR